MTLYDYIIEKSWCEKHQERQCPHLLVAKFYRDYTYDEYYCVACKKKIDEKDTYNSYPIQLFQDPTSPDVIIEYLTKMDEEILRLYQTGLNREFLLAHLAGYLFNFACANFKDPFADEEPKR